MSNACEVVKWNKMTRKVGSKKYDGRNAILMFKFDPQLQHWNECYRFSRPDKKYLPLVYIYAQEEVVVVNYDVVFTDATYSFVHLVQEVHEYA